MKQIKLFLFTAFVTLSAFAVVFYSSCKKDPCKGVDCQNGGACSGGACSCPTGYSGANCEYSTIVFQNDAPTTLYLTVNGTATTIPSNSTISYVGTAGSSISVSSISTYGPYGAIYTWTGFSDNFPTGGNGLTEPFNVDPTYFYLRITNTLATQSIVNVKVNYNSAAQTSENVNINNDGITYDMGYYPAYSNTELYALGSGGFFYTYIAGPSIPAGPNATYNWQVY